MYDRLVDLHYAESDFKKHVLIRENAASTAFNNIAIPHSVKMEAYKLCISVCISKDGIIWGDQTVYIVLLIAISKTDKQIFHDIYEAVITLFSTSDIITMKRQCNSFIEFKNIIFNNIGKINKEI